MIVMVVMTAAQRHQPARGEAGGAGGAKEAAALDTATVDRIEHAGEDLLRVHCFSP